MMHVCGGLKLVRVAISRQSGCGGVPVVASAKVPDMKRRSLLGVALMTLPLGYVFRHVMAGSSLSLGSAKP
jgi:hypothetical protein